MLMESCDLGENFFQIIARSMPYFENDFSVAHRNKLYCWQTSSAYMAHFIDRVNRESAA